MTIQEIKAMSVDQRLFVLVAWLAKQPRDTEYDFIDTANCALCSFGRTFGSEWVSSGGYHFSYGDDLDKRERIRVITGEAEIALVRSQTFGELYDKLLPLVTPPLLPTVELSEAALEALELRPLIHFERTKA